MIHVSVEKADSYQPELVAKVLNRLLTPHGGLGTFIRPGDRVLLKPNMLAAKPPEAAVTTHPAIVREVIRLVQQAGGIALVGDSPGIGGIKRVAEKTGILEVVREMGAELVPFEEAVEIAGGGLFKSFHIAREYVEADRVINLPKLKTHEMMTITCGVKNLFGTVVGTAKAGWHLKAGADRDLFARLLVEICLLRVPNITIVDAIVAMEGDGPGSGDPKAAGFLLAGTDPVAVDVVAANIAGIPKNLRYVERAARSVGLPGADVKHIRISGEVPEVAAFRLPHQSDVQFGLPPFLKNRLRHYLTSRPVQDLNKCKLCGVCRDACPPHAINISGDRLHFDYKSCIRCFCCRELCPDAALHVEDGALLNFMKKFK